MASDATIIIVDDDHAGAFSFSSEVFKVTENVGTFKLKVNRTRGARGAVSVPYTVAEGTARLGKDMDVPTSGTLHFKDGVTSMDIPIKIINDDAYEKAEDFFVYLGEPTWHVGWICFIVSIIFIGILTAFIGDVASHFGCTIGLKDAVTAITLVAMGTSLPDTFASKTAAIQDKTADASIGNVTGSNAVNVFLGIGVAWAIASCYHAWNGTIFRVQSGALAPSVALFCIGSVICIAILQFRRYSPSIRGELGGPMAMRYISAAAFISIWVAYITYSVLDAYCII